MIAKHKKLALHRIRDLHADINRHTRRRLHSHHSRRRFMSSYLKSLLSTAADEPPDDSDDLHGRLLTRRRLLILFVLLYAAWFMYSQRARHRSGVWGPRWAALFAANVCLAIGRACGLTFTVAYEEDDKLRAKHRGLVAAVGPHGVFPLAMLGFGAFKFRQDLKDCGIGEPGLIDLNARFAGASIVFTVPIIRELLFLMGVRDANRTTLKKLLNAGHTIAIQPGGIWEMVMTDSSQVRARAHAHHSHAPHLSLSHTPLSLTHTPLSPLSRRRPSTSSAPSASSASQWRWAGRSSRATPLARTSYSSRGAATAYAYGSRGSCV